MELSERKVIGPDLIQETEEKVKMIREKLKVATDRQKSYADIDSCHGRMIRNQQNLFPIFLLLL